jgi:hypothetical protein
VGNATMVYLNISPGQLPLQQQIPRLRLATAHAFLYETRLAELLPPWASVGMAGYVARQGLQDPQMAAMQVDGLPAFQGENRRDKRGNWAPQPELDRGEQDAIDRFQMLLLGNDAQLAVGLFDALRETCDRPLPNDRSRHRYAQKPAILAPSLDPTPVDRFLEQHADELPQWKKNPWAGQPILDSDQTTDGVRGPSYADGVVQSQMEEMMLILKLARRFHVRPFAGVRPRTIEFGPRGSSDVSAMTGEPVVTLAALRQRLTDVNQPAWATVDVDGQLLMSYQRERIDQLLGNSQGRYQSYLRDGRWVLTYRRPDNTVIEGWLEDNIDNPQRPLARFVVHPQPNSTNTTN